MCLKWIYLSTSLAIEQVTICTVASYPTLKEVGSDYQDISDEVHLKWKKFIAWSRFPPDLVEKGSGHSRLSLGFDPFCLYERSGL